MAINIVHGQNLVTSMSRAYTKATKTGKLNLGVVALYDLISYYVEFTRGKAEFNQEYAFLLDKLLSLQYANPTIICNYKAQSSTLPLSTITNTAPTVSDKIIDIEGASTYRFTVGDFITDFADAENHLPKYVLIYPPEGTIPDGRLLSKLFFKGRYRLSFSNIINGTGLTYEFPSPYIVDISGKDASALFPMRFFRDNGLAFTGNTFTFRVSDDPEDYLYSNAQTITINASLVEESGANNLPATIGDNVIYASNRTTTILTLAMFTSSLTPPYNDPEADLIDAIRIDEISTSNVGVFKYNGTPILEGDIITREDLQANLFTHEGPDQDAISSDVFNFSARDEGSQIWVQ